MTTEHANHIEFEPTAELIAIAKILIQRERDGVITIPVTDEMRRIASYGTKDGDSSTTAKTRARNLR